MIEVIKNHGDAIVLCNTLLFMIKKGSSIG